MDKLQDATTPGQLMPSARNGASSSALTLALATSSIGTILGVMIGLKEVEAHGYTDMGYVRNAILTLRGPVYSAAVSGLLVGIGFAILRLGRASLVDARRQGSMRPTLVALALCVLAILARSLHMGSISFGRVAIVTLAAGGWFFLYSRWRPLDFRDPATRLNADFLLPLPLGFLIAVLFFGKGMLGGFSGVEGAAWLLGAGLASLGAMRWSDRPMRNSTDWIGRACLCALPGLAVLGHFIPMKSIPHGLDPGQRSIVLVVIDTLRADRTQLLDAPASGRDLTPELRKFAQRGTVFTHAYSQAPWTMPAYASMITGRYPSQHRATAFGDVLPPSEMTLSETLREAGYRTVGVISHTIMGAHCGFAQGFDEYDEECALGSSAVTAERVTDKVLNQLSREGGGPVFVLAHYFDPHYEYHNHEDWDYADSYQGWLVSDSLNVHGLRNARHRLNDADRHYLMDLYDEEIAYTDREVGRLLQTITEQHPNAAVVVVADHGEEFFERGWLGHTTTLHTEVIAAPLIAYLPGMESPPTSATNTVETRSVYSTLLESAGVRSPGSESPASLQSLLATDTEGSAYSQVHLLNGNRSDGKYVFLSSLRTDSTALILDHLTGQTKIYDLEADPGEQAELAPSARPGVLLKLEEWLAGAGRVGGVTPRAALTPEFLQQLRDLGYTD